MTIKRGPRNNPRKNARNITHKQAQARLTETVVAFNNQVQNSLAVDAVKVTLYQVNRLIGRPCTCCMTNVPRAPGSNMAPVIPDADRTNEGFELDLQDDDIFGSSFSDKIMNDDVINVSGGMDDGLMGVSEPDDDIYDDALMQGSVNCGICYRTLRQPGYKAYGMQRTMFTNYDMENVSGYTVDSTSAPHAFVQERGDGFVSFQLVVPLYFKAVTFSVREDLKVLHDRPLNDENKELKIDELRRYAGRTMEFRVKAQRFTHVIFEFDLGIERLNANIGGENTVLNYDRLQTMADIPIVLGPEVQDVNEGDIVAIPERRLFLKIHDKERKITADQRRLEWVCNARVLQPTEPLIHIARGYRLR